MKMKFTLLELLVVISIVSILLSLTLPAVSKARSKIHAAVCSGNLKSIGQGALIYSNDFDDYSMPASFGNTSDGAYNHFINYMIACDGYTIEAFQCPSMDEEEMFDPAGHDPVTGNIYTNASYIMNIIKPGNWGGSGLTGTDSLFGWGLDSTTPIKVGYVKEPSSKLHFMDVMGGISNSHSGVNNFQRSDHGVFADPPTGLKRWIGLQHGGQYNTVFGDGHAGKIGRSRSEDWAVNL